MTLYQLEIRSNFCEEHHIPLHKIEEQTIVSKGPGQIEEIIDIADEIIHKTCTDSK